MAPPKITAATNWRTGQLNCNISVGHTSHTSSFIPKNHQKVYYDVASASDQRHRPRDTGDGRGEGTNRGKAWIKLSSVTFVSHDMDIQFKYPLPIA